MENNSNPFVKIESELYSLVNSVLELNSKFKKGMINEGFFYKSLKNNINQFHKINNYCKENRIAIQDILKRMDFVDNYNKALDVINEISSTRFSNDEYRESERDLPKSSERLKSSLLDLPKIASDITASFITLMDSLKLEIVSNYDQLFNEILQNLSQFSSLQSVSKKVKDLFEQITKDRRKMVEIPRYREQVTNQLWDIYNEFQKRLSFKV